MLSQCSKCGLSKSTGAMGSVLPQCQCDWRMPSKEDAPLVKWVKEQTAPQRTWVGLTDEEVRQMCGSVPSMKEAVREAESKLKERNT